MKTMMLFLLLIGCFFVSVCGFASTFTLYGQHPAKLCSQCGFGNRASQCVKCGGAFATISATLCSQCGFGNQSTMCVKCGQAFASVPAKLCNQCGFGSQANACVKCGNLF